ncbi:MAG: HAMP domain-containing protein [SAR324 cluster bacterium]|nr:HAMP domain-containing protein [SAR324 cluster bacterium]
MLKNMKIANKLSLIVASFVIPILILLFLLIETHQWRIDFAQKEITGDIYLRHLRQLQENIQKYHLDLVTQTRGSNSPAAIEDTLERLKKEGKTQSGTLNIDSQIEALTTQWDSLKYQTGSTKTLELVQTFAATLKGVITVVGDESNLILDPDLDTYYLMDATLLKLPKLEDLMTQTMLFSQQILSNPHALSMDEKIQIIVLLGNVESTLQEMSDGLQLAITHNTDKYDRTRLIANVMKQPLQNTRETTQEFLKIIREGVVQTSSINISYDKIQAAGLHALSAQFGLWDKAIVELDGLLNERISGLNTTKYTQLVAVALVLMLSLCFCVVIVRAITHSLLNAQHLMTELATGNLELKVEVTSTDETGKVLSVINFVLDSLKSIVTQILIATNKLIGTFNEMKNRSESMLAESEQIHSDTLLIVKEAGNLNQGVNANVQDLKNISGEISSLAAAIEELSSNLNTISNNAQDSSNNMVGVSKNIEQFSNNIQTLSASAQQMSVALSSMSDSARETNQISSEAKQDANEMVSVMNELHESSTRIGKIVKLIDNIAGQTSMLALNATIEAASAGDAGRGFAVVASEVKNLAQQTATANNEIAEQISQVQTHIRKAMENTQTVTGVISRVVEINQKVGSSIDEQHQSANEIAQSIYLLADAGKNASLNTHQAEKGLKEISRAVSEAFLASKEVSINVAEGNQELHSVTARNVASLDQLKNVNLHIANIQKSVESIHNGNQHMYDMSTQISTQVDALKNSVSIFRLNNPGKEEALIITAI